MKRLWLVGSAAIALYAAGLGCSDALPPADRVDKLRVLAVRAEPPEIAPGQASTLDSLTVTPASADAAQTADYLWLACTEPSGVQLPAACGVTAGGNGGPGALGPAGDGGVPSGVPLCADKPDAPLCLVGVGPRVSLAPSVTLAQGATTQVIVTLIVSDGGSGSALACAMSAAQGSGAPPDPDHCIIALKRLTISNGVPPNHNPHLARFTLDGSSLPDGMATFHRTAGAATPEHPALAAERCRKTDIGTLANCPIGSHAEVETDGTVEPLYVTWFTTAGAIADSRSSFQVGNCTDACLKDETAVKPSVATRWTVPDANELLLRAPLGVVHFWAVVRDDRGGVGWLDGHAAAE